MFTGVIIAIGGYIMLISTPNIWIEYGGTFLVAVGIFPTSPVILAWLSNNLAPHYMRAAGTGYQIMIANCGAFIATFTYVQADAPRYITGHAINLGVIGAAAVLIVILIFYNKAENRMRANGHRDDRLREGNEWMLGSRHPNVSFKPPEVIDDSTDDCTVPIHIVNKYCSLARSRICLRISRTISELHPNSHQTKSHCLPTNCHYHHSAFLESFILSSSPFGTLMHALKKVVKS